MNQKKNIFFTRLRLQWNLSCRKFFQQLKRDIVSCPADLRRTQSGLMLPIKTKI